MAESSSWDGVAASLRQTNAHVESTFGAVVRENASLNAQRYAQDAAMAEMRCELARLRSEAADVLGRREVMEEAGRLEKRVAGLQRELSASNAAERALQEERVALADALHSRERALERAAAALDASRASEAALGALRAEGAADVVTLRRELELRTAAEARCREEGGLLRAQNDDLVTRLVADKQRLVGEMNGMNDIIDRLKRELELRAEEAPPAPTGGRRLLDTARSFFARADDADDGAPPADAPEPEAWDVVRALPSGDARCVLHRALGGDASDVCFDEGGSLLAAAACGGSVHVWEGVDGLGATPPRPRFTAAPKDKRDGGALCVAASADAVAATFAGRSLRLWDARAGRLRVDLSNAHGGAAKIYGLAFLRRSRVLVTAATDRAGKACFKFAST